MEEKRTGLFENGLIWFGAGITGQKKRYISYEH